MKMQNKQTFKERYKSLPQRKQRIKTKDFNILIEVKPYPVSTVYGDGRLQTIAYVFNALNIGSKGGAIFNHDDDEFDFRFGAQLALKRALDVRSEPYHLEHWRFFGAEIRKAIWNEFNKVLPKE